MNTIVDNSRSSMPPYVVGASVGGGLALLLVCGVVYQYYQSDKEAKARELRKTEYYRQQALIAEQARIEREKFLQEQERRVVAKKASQNKVNKNDTKQQRAHGAHGAQAVSTIADEEEAGYMPPLHITPSYNSSSSSFDISPLHSSEERSVRRRLRHIVNAGSDSEHSLSDTSESDSDSTDSGL